MNPSAPSKATAGGANQARGDQTARSVDSRKHRLAPIWPEWNDADVNAESWEVGSGKKKETGANRARVDTKSASIGGTHGFEDPEGKIELPPTLKVDQWKRPVDFLPPERPPVIVDIDQGMQNFDLVTPNEHLHFNDTMRNIISQITALWDICRRERKPTSGPDNTPEQNAAVLSGRTWRPWEHIYALNKVSRQPFVTPYNPAGKYVIRLFFLGTWRKLVVDDTIPFDSKNRCLLPQTSLPHELWPLLLSKGLLKIMSLDYRPPTNNPPSIETSIIHTLTGWLPEPIPLKYTHAGKVWDFLRNDRSNKLVTENETNKTDHPPTSPLPTYGPVPLYKWPEPKTEITEEAPSSQSNEQPGHQDDTATETLTKKSDEKSTKKGGAPAAAPAPKDPPTKTTTGKENRGGKDSKRLGGAGRGGTTDDSGSIIDDQTIPEAPKMIVFANIPQSPSARISAYGEVADRSEKLRRYNLNDTFSTTMLLTTIRDIPLEPPPPPEYVPPWKLIRPKKPKVLPHAEPFTPREPKPDRWIEITSPYINYPSPSALNMNIHTPPHGATSRLSHSATHSTVVDVPDIIEVDEDEDGEHAESRVGIDIDQGDAHKKEENISPSKEMPTTDTPDIMDESLRSAGSKLRQEKSADKNKNNRKLTSSKIEAPSAKAPSDAVSVKSKAGESEPTGTQVDAPGTGTATNPEQQDSQSKTNDANSGPKATQPMKKMYTTPKIWMEFDDFCSCFASIVVYHNPRGYQYSHKHTELKYLAAHQPAVTSVTKEKKKEPNPPASQQIPNLQDEKSPLYLFVDSTRESLGKNIELIVGLTALSRWHDSGQPDASGPPAPGIPTIPEKGGRNTALSTDRGPTELSPARGKHRQSVFEAPQTPAPHVPSHDPNPPENNPTLQKDSVPQPGLLIAEIHSWKSVSMGQPILRLHTTATKAALLTLPPGRHVLKFTVTCPLASHLQIMSDTHDFTFGDEDQLLTKVVSVPEDAEFIARAEELLYALDDSIQNFNDMDQQDGKLNELFRTYCQYAPESANLTIQKCWKIFNDAIYATLRTVLHSAGQALNTETQYAWRCFTNDLATPDIMGVYESRQHNINTRNSARPSNVALPGNPAPTGTSTTGKKGGGKDKGGADDKAASKQQTALAASLSATEMQEEPVSEWLSRELSTNEMDAIVNIQKSARGYLQRRILNARTPGTERNLLIQRALQSTMTILKNDVTKSAILLFRNLMSIKPELIQCFAFRNDDWNMVTYRDYHGQHQEQPANTWFTLFREIFYATETSFVAARLLAHAQNSVLRVINNDTYQEMPLIFNRLAPATFTKNKLGYTFFAEGVTLDQPLVNNRYRLRLLTSYAHLPEPRSEQLTSAFVTKESKGYYVPNRDQIICRYRVIVGDDVNQAGRNFHLASIQFSTSKADVLMRLTVLDGKEEMVSIEGKGSIVLPAMLFLRDVTNTAHAGVQAPLIPIPQISTPTTATTAAPAPSRPASKTGGKKDGKGAGGARGSISEPTPPPTASRPEKEKIGSGKRSRSSSRAGVVTEEEEKIHKYIIQVTLLRKSWPLTATQWQFVEQLKEQEKNDLKVFKQPTAAKPDGTAGGTAGTTGANTKRAGQAGAAAAAAGKGKGAAAAAGAAKGATGTSGRPGTGKGTVEKPIDTTKAHWILRVVCDADKADELTIKKDNERNEELINTKKAWETLEAGRAQKAMQTRQKFLDSLQPKAEERPLSAATDGSTKPSETQPDDKTVPTTATTTTAPSTVPPPAEQQPVAKQPPATTTKKGASSTGTKKGAAKDEAAKQAELAAAAAAQQEAAPILPPLPAVDEPLLDQPPPTKPKIILPPLDIKPFTKQKLSGDEPVVVDPLFEQEELRRRQAEFLEYAKYADEIRQFRTEDQNNRYKEKIRQLEEYVDLQGKIDQFRRTVNEPREAFRQRFLEVERKRLAELAAKEQELIAAAEKNKPPPTDKGKKGKGKGSAGAKGKK